MRAQEEEAAGSGRRRVAGVIAGGGGGEDASAGEQRLEWAAEDQWLEEQGIVGPPSGGLDGAGPTGRGVRMGLGLAPRAPRGCYPLQMRAAVAFEYTE